MSRNSKQPPPRPPCLCGQPAFYIVSVSAEPLTLEREAGMRSEPYWTRNYRARTMVTEVHMCTECFSSRVNLSVALAADLKAKRKP